MRISKKDQISQLAPLLKVSGYLKKAATWHRKTPDGVHVVNIQGSQWGPEYYLNLGFYIRALGDEESPTSYRCHVQSRIMEPDRDASSIVLEIEQWFALNGTVNALLERKKDGNLPIITTGRAIEYLTGAT